MKVIENYGRAIESSDENLFKEIFAPQIRLEPIASRHGATISQITLAWLLARSPAIMPVPGTTSMAHLRENLDAQDIELNREDIQSINSIAPEPRASIN